MKGILLSLASIISVIFVGCNKDDLSSESITISVVADGAYGTRADDSTPSRYLLELYSDASYSTMVGEQYTSTSGVFSITLNSTESYYMLLWADVDGGSVYSTDDLKCVELNSGATPVEAWGGSATIAEGTTGNISIELGRAVAKLTLWETGSISEGSVLTMSFMQPTSFLNSANGGVSTSTERVERISITSAVEGSAQSAVQLNVDEIYILAPQSAESVLDITFQMEGLYSEEAFQVTNVPTQANHATNIIGAYSQVGTVTFTITTGSAWDGEIESNSSADESDTTQTPDIDSSATEGSATNPYQITSVSDLRSLSLKVSEGESYVGEYFLLSGSIDLEGLEFTPIGDATNQFKGVFNGWGYTISGLSVNNSEQTNQGLFGYVGALGEVKNLTVEGSVVGYDNVGGVAGWSDGEISGCHNLASVSSASTSSQTIVGGVVGYSTAKVINCSNGGAVSGTYKMYLGGVVGSTTAEVVNCYNQGSVSGVSVNFMSISYVGGVVGVSTSNIENCYSTGLLSGDSQAAYIGGIAGNSKGSISGCYYLSGSADSGAYKNEGSGSCTSKSSEEMTSSDFVTTLNSGVTSYNSANATSTQACEWVAVSGGYPIFK